MGDSQHQAEPRHACVIRGVRYELAMMSMKSEFIIFIFEPIHLAVKLSFNAMSLLRHKSPAAFREEALVQELIKIVQARELNDMIVGDLEEARVITAVHLTPVNPGSGGGGELPKDWDHDKMMRNLIEVNI